MNQALLRKYYYLISYDLCTALTSNLGQLISEYWSACLGTRITLFAIQTCLAIYILTSFQRIAQTGIYVYQNYKQISQ